MGRTFWGLINCTCKCNQMVMCFHEQVTGTVPQVHFPRCKYIGHLQEQVSANSSKADNVEQLFSISTYEFYLDISWVMDNLHMQLLTEFDVFNIEMKYSLFLLLYFDAKQQALGLIHYYRFHTKCFPILHQYKLWSVKGFLCFHLWIETLKYTTSWDPNTTSSTPSIFFIFFSIFI